MLRVEIYPSGIIGVKDIDVLRLCVSVSDKMAWFLCQKLGTQNRTCHIDVSKLESSLDDGVSQGLIGLDALTGCDTFSAFAGHGKLGALKLLKDGETYQRSFKQLGEEWDVSRDLFDKMQEFVCRMYASSSTICEVNEPHYQLFYAKRGEVEI